MAVAQLDQEFAALIGSLQKLAGLLDPSTLYRRPPDVSIGENIVRSGAVLEQLFGGLTANLWDDPFEWTLPESLSTPDRLIAYLGEVDLARQRTFSSIKNDNDLLKLIPVPSGEPRRLLHLLLETMAKGATFQNEALVAFKMLSDEGAPGFII